MSEPLTIGRNIERILGLWPSAGLSVDWIDLFRDTFRNLNQEWLAEAINRVKLRRASHVPEMSWFWNEFHEIKRGNSAAGERAAKTPDERAAERAEAFERMRIEAEQDRERMLAWVLGNLERLPAAREYLSRSMVAVVVENLPDDPRAWGAFRLGMIWAAMQPAEVRAEILARGPARDELARKYAATFAA